MQEKREERVREEREKRSLNCGHYVLPLTPRGTARNLIRQKLMVANSLETPKLVYSAGKTTPSAKFKIFLDSLIL